MNFPRVALAAITAWIIYFLVSFVVHNFVLAGLYQEHATLMRPQPEQLRILPVGLAMALVGFFAFAYAYAKGYEGGYGAQEGLRFGVLVGILICCFSVVFEYMAWPVSSRLFVAWLVEYIVEFAVYGSIVGWVYKPRAIVRRSAPI
jgi:hypothetical protein